MSTPPERVALGSFACEFGDRERTPESIEDFAAIWTAKGLGLGLAAMGGKTFWQMTRPIESYVVRCVAATIASSGVAAKEVSHIVFSTMDQNLRHLDRNFARKILVDLELVNCIPKLISMQQCVSSLAAVDHARRLFVDPNVHHVILVTFDFVVEDAERIESFAVFGDAVASCMMSRGDAVGLALRSYGVSMDAAGLLGRDNHESRKQMMVSAVAKVLEESGVRLEDVAMCFATNLFKPIALFNAGVCGIHRSRLYIETSISRAHCGNCDWMLNLRHYQEAVGVAPGKKYLVVSSAPWFFACGLLESPG